jgi:hypothetical protein
MYQEEEIASLQDRIRRIEEIAWVLLECEAIYCQHGINNNRRNLLLRSPYERDQKTSTDRTYLQSQYNDNWYRFVIQKLVIECRDAKSLLDNNVTFVMFNYDVSLEYQLYLGIRAIQQFAGTEFVDKFFDESRFIHIYGRIRQGQIATPPIFDLALLEGLTFGVITSPEATTFWSETKNLLDTIYEASKGIRTIAPNEKIISPDVERAKQAITEAKYVYILGYGFDSNNSRLLDLKNSLALETTHKSVLFTNFCNYNIVNKNASRLGDGGATL